MDWISYLNKVSSNEKTKSTHETKAREIPKQSQITSNHASMFLPDDALPTSDLTSTSSLKNIAQSPSFVHFSNSLGFLATSSFGRDPSTIPSQTHGFQGYLHGAKFSMS